MNLEKLKFWRSLLFRTAGVSYLLAAFSSLIAAASWTTWQNLVVQWYHTTPEAIGSVILCYFTGIKFFIVYLLLAPAIGLHWTIKANEKAAPEGTMASPGNKPAAT